MIRSMTAFARFDITGTWGIATWELRSLNQRYLETCIRLPETFKSLEPAIRDRIRTYLTRGKVECELRCQIKSSIQQTTLFFNKKLAKELLEIAQWVKMQSKEGTIDPLAILSWSGVITVEEKNYDYDVISTELMVGLDATLCDLVNVREKEGNILKKLIEQRLVAVSHELYKIRQQMPALIAWQRKKLFSKINELHYYKAENDSVDHVRLEQEFVMLAQRLDISEELDRLEAHLTETYHILTKKEAVGRRLDFMMQEFNRESNTLASKSINASITASAIELKVLIEQMREQIQNIE